jgi:hypothetical protein
MIRPQSDHIWSGKMPNLILTEADFEKLSASVKSEIWELLQNSFPSNAGSNDSLVTKTKDHITNVNPASFELLSIETAIAVLIGLSAESREVVSILCKRQLDRYDLTKILGSEKRINGTIGSINRRLVKRLNETLYGKRRDRVKLIESQDGLYRLSCDSRSLEIAQKIIHKGYKIGDGDIVVKFGEGSSLAEVHIEEEAIVQIDSGQALVLLHSWDHHIGDDLCAPIGLYVICSNNTNHPNKIVVSTHNEDEWEPNSFSGPHYPYGDLSEIFIGGKKR